MAIDLLTPLLDEGIRNPNFFEGRLLTAADLRADQEAQRARQRRLGRALGSGVVKGLWVTIANPGGSGETPSLHITGGLALNRKGQTLEIAKESETVRLVIPAETTSTDAGLFADCQQTPTGVTAIGEGIYVLVLSPASGFRDRAAMSGLSKGTGSAGCGSRWVIEGVQLRLEPWDPLQSPNLGQLQNVLAGLLGATGLADRHKLRNILAHLCLGTPDHSVFAADPFARDTDGHPALHAYGPLDALYTAGALTDCDVPLALVYWTASGVQFVDNWAVRRRPSPPATAPNWPFLSGGRQRGEAEATLFQFQDQLAGLLEKVTDPSTVIASEYFYWMPPICLIPLAGESRGFSEEMFFSGFTLRSLDPNQLVLGVGELRHMVESSFSYSPAYAGSPDLLHAVLTVGMNPYTRPYRVFVSYEMPVF